LTGIPEGKDLDGDGMIILKLISDKYNGIMNWINLDEDRDYWRALVKTVMNLQVA
jgi:hypothetical protein